MSLVLTKSISVFDPEEEEEPVMNIIVEQDIKPYLTLTIRKMSVRY